MDGKVRVAKSSDARLGIQWNLLIYTYAKSPVSVSVPKKFHVRSDMSTVVEIVST